MAERSEVTAERVAADFRSLPFGAALDVIKGGAVTALLVAWLAEPRAFLWLAGVLAVAALRIALWVAWRRRASASPARPAAWGGTSAALAGAAGLLWGGGAAWLWPELLAHKVVWVFLVVGMSAVVAVLHHAYLPVAIAFIGASGIPLIVRLVTEDPLHGGAAAAMVAVLLAAVLAGAARGSQAVGRAIALQLDLARREAELREAHARLQAEMAERRAAEEALRQSQKMEAVGQLAGGIAHDMNNILQAVAGGAALIRRRASDAVAVTRLAEMVTEAARRGETVTRRLLAFARRGELRPEVLEIHGLLDSLRGVLSATLPPGIAVRIEAPANLPAVRSDRNQLETALVNLAINARDAMPQGGHLVISASVEEVRPPGRNDRPRPGTYLRLDVLDDGQGMSAATLARATEPFFTTKGRGRGTGLGLSLTQRFAEGSGGALAIESAPGAGTRVTLWLPVADAPAPAGPAAPAPRPSVSGPRPELLVVDDEPSVREVLAQELQAEGYGVTTATDGEAALALVERGTPFDLLICDLAMPGPDGVTVIRKVRDRRPGLPAILLTGYAGDAAELAVRESLEGAGAFALLRKPLAGDRLADMVGVLLDASARGERSRQAVSPASAPPA